VEEVENKKNNNNEKLVPSNATNIKKHKQLLGWTTNTTKENRRILLERELGGIMKRPSPNVVVCPTI